MPEDDVIDYVASDLDNLYSEVARLSQENADLRERLDQLEGESVMDDARIENLEMDLMEVKDYLEDVEAMASDAEDTAAQAMERLDNLKSV